MKKITLSVFVFFVSVFLSTAWAAVVNISGVVSVDAVPQAGVSVVATTGSSAVVCAIATGSDGVYTCPVPDAGQTNISAKKAGFAFATLYRNNAVVAETSANIQGFALTRTISGFVKDAAGNVLSDIEVYWSSINFLAGSSYSGFCSTTLADGAFTCQLPQGFTVSVSAYQSKNQSFVFAPLARTNVTIDEAGAVITGVALAHTISGFVKDASGNLLSGAQVSWYVPWTSSSASYSTYSTYCNTTLADGAFTCRVPQGFTGVINAYIPASASLSKSFTSVVADLTGQIIAAGSVTVAGTVSVSGIAQAGVRVEYSDDNSSTPSLCTSSTGADGSYSCNVPNSGQIKIIATRLGYVFSSITRTDLPGSEVGASIQGDIARNVTGAVKDASGNPLSGVSINWQSQSNNSYMSGQCGVTDTTGNFSCDVPSSQVWILGNQTGFAFEQIYRANLVADESGAIMRGAALVRTISGFVKDASGNLLSGINVNWSSLGTTVSGSFSSICNTTLADGAFTCRVPQGFTGTINAYLPSSGSLFKVYTSVAADLTDQIIAVVNVTVAGTVSVNGVTQAGVRVEFSVNNSATTTLCTVSTGADGGYSCNVPNSGQIKIMALQLGYVFLPITRYNLSGSEVGASIQGVIVRNVTGSVNDASGNPLSGVSINWQSQSNGSNTSGQCGVTDATGNFSCGVPSGQVWILGSQTGFAFEQIYRANLVADESGVSMRGAALVRTISGFVKDANGNLLSGINVYWSIPGTTVSGGFSSYCNATLADGAFTCRVPQGFTGSLNAYANNSPSFAFSPLSRVNVVNDESGLFISGVALIRTISGIVKDASGNVLSGINVNWSTPTLVGGISFNSSCYTTTADGVFTCRVPQGFTGFLSAYQGSGQSFAFALLSRTNVTIDETGVVISGVALARTISGFVKDASGNVLSGAQVNWFEPGTSCSASYSAYCNTTLADGAFSCRVPQGFTGNVNARLVGATSSSTVAFTNVTADLVGQIITASNGVTSATVLLTTTRTGAGAGSINSSPAGIGCGTTCSFSFNKDTSVTLTATPAIGSTFTGWSGDCTGSSTCVVNLGTAKSISANFAISTGSSLNVPFVLNPGWNLLGNSLNQPLTMASAFSDPAVVTTVWKWDAATSGWQFYAPSMTAAALQTYAASKNYAVLNSINPGEGYWVNAKVSTTFANQTGAPFNLTNTNLQLGWNLVATGNDVSPSAFNQSLSVTPPAPGVIPSNITTLWAWNSATSQWFFYAPTLEASRGLGVYTTSKSYLDFSASGKTLGNGVGFWVNRP